MSVFGILSLIAGAWLASVTGVAAAPTPAREAPEAPEAPVVQAAEPGSRLTRTDLEAWLDGYLPSALTRNDMAGAVVVVVKDGKVLLQKGYGFADVASRKPVDPERTLFTLASVTKTITGTAVMQLVEQGKLDLDRDVNDYLDFKIPQAWGKPITLRNLLTHTAGFDDLQKGSSPKDPEWYMSLEGYMKRRSPNRVFPPGKTPAYSNYGMALAAYIVQLKSGELYEDYIDRHIFRPLGMLHSTTRQPAPPNLKKDEATAYRRGSLPPAGQEFINPRGAGGAKATGSDVARYMIAHLNEGRYGDVQILRPETARLMHEEAFRATPRLPGMAIAFFRLDRNGERIVGHDGDSKGVHSNLFLLLDRNVGVFVGFNADGRDTAVYGVRDALFTDFVDRYYPAPIPQEPAISTGREHGLMAQGSYQSSRRLNGVLSVFMMLNSVTLTSNPDGTISYPAPPTGEVQVYREIAPFLWRQNGGKALLEMRVEDGKVVSFHDHPVGAFIKTPTWRTGDVNIPLTLGAVAALLATVVAWLGAALVRLRYGRAFPLAGREAVAFRLVRVGAAAMVLFVIGWALLTANLQSHFYMFNASLDPWIRALHAVGLLGVAGALVAVWNLWLVWRGKRGWWAKVWSLVLTAALLWMAYFAFAFNLITLSLNY